MYSKKNRLKIHFKVVGQGMVEYVALTALVAILCIGTVKVFGGKVRSRLTQITNTFDRNIQQGLKARGSASSEDGSVEAPRRNGPFKIPGLPDLLPDFSNE